MDEEPTVETREVDAEEPTKAEKPRKLRFFRKAKEHRIKGKKIVEPEQPIMEKEAEEPTDEREPVENEPTADASDAEHVAAVKEEVAATITEEEKPATDEEVVEKEGSKEEENEAEDPPTEEEDKEEESPVEEEDENESPKEDTSVEARSASFFTNQMNSCLSPKLDCQDKLDCTQRKLDCSQPSETMDDTAATPTTGYLCGCM